MLRVAALFCVGLSFSAGTAMAQSSPIPPSLSPGSTTPVTDPLRAVPGGISYEQIIVAVCMGEPSGYYKCASAVSAQLASCGVMQEPARSSCVLMVSLKAFVGVPTGPL